jgi:enoyl-CoA hydratase
MTVHLERVDAHVAVLTIDRPPVNAVDRATQRALAEHLGALTDDATVRAIVLTGAGRAFCAGADLREEQDLDRDDVGGLLGDIGRMLLGVREHRVPVIAAVNGAAFGGGLELALACDLRIAAKSASFGAAGVNVGLIASFHSLTEAIGAGRARHMLLTGERCPAERAVQWGLCTEVVDDATVVTRSIELATTIASKSPLSVEAAKRALNAVGDLTSGEAGALQTREFITLFRTADHAEALRAFFEKRPGIYERR